MIYKTQLSALATLQPQSIRVRENLYLVIFNDYDPAVKGRWIGLQLLNSVFGTEFDDRTVTTGPDGRPHLENSEYDFNVSHSANYLAVACAKNLGVGLDLETYKSWDRIEKLARRFFSKEELKQLDLHSSKDKKEAEFLRIWTEKEARIKFEGMSLFSKTSNQHPCFFHLEPLRFGLSLVYGPRL